MKIGNLKFKGFTLVELLVVLIILAVLAAIAAPMMSAQKAKAISSEAVTTLGYIRTAIRMYYVECSGYISYMGLGLPNYLYTSGYINNDFINGRYFSSECYSLVNELSYGGDDHCYEIICDSSKNTSPRANEVNAVICNSGSASFQLIMWNTGKINQVNASKTGYPPLDSSGPY